MEPPSKTILKTADANVDGKKMHFGHLLFASLLCCFFGTVADESLSVAVGVKTDMSTDVSAPTQPDTAAAKPLQQSTAQPKPTQSLIKTFFEFDLAPVSLSTMTSPHRSNTNTNVDLDVFLTAVESKLRGPFSSLDWTKTVTTPALRGSHVSQVAYLQHVRSVLSKSDKISQMRILIGLLGLEPNNHNNDPEQDDNETMDGVIYSILRQAQGKGEEHVRQTQELTYEERLAHRYEEWVRVIAGLIQGIMFKEEDGQDKQSFGEEALELLDASCQEVLQQVKEMAESSTQQHALDEEEKQQPKQHKPLTALPLTTVDFDSTLAPFRYSLINPDLLQHVIPDALGDNPHFRLNTKAKVLTEDTQMEVAMALEEAEHAASAAAVPQKGGASASARTTSSSSDRSGGSSTQAPMAYMPGMRRQQNRSKSPTNAAAAAAAKKAQPQRNKPSLFVTKKPPMAAKKGGVHVRKTGAAQRLVGKGRSLTGGGDTSLSGSASRLSGGGGTRGRALKAGGGAAGAGRSRMKLLDDTEAVDLAKQRDGKGGRSRSPKMNLKRKAAAMTGGGVRNVAKTPGAGRGRGAKVSRTAHVPAALGGDGGDDDDDMEEEAPPAMDSPPAEEAPPASPPPEASAFDNEYDDDDEEHAGALAAAALTKYQTQVATTPAAPTATKKEPPSGANALAAEALNKYQTQQQQQQATDKHTAKPAAATTPKQLNWQQLIAEKSNRLSDDDRQRVQLFFEQKTNPTPGQMVYKMKLHEERTTDPATQKPIKETYYLELNYDNFTSKQSKKTKRYDK